MRRLTKVLACVAASAVVILGGSGLWAWDRATTRWRERYREKPPEFLPEPVRSGIRSVNELALVSEWTIKEAEALIALYPDPELHSDVRPASGELSDREAMSFVRRQCRAVVEERLVHLAPPIDEAARERLEQWIVSRLNSSDERERVGVVATLVSSGLARKPEIRARLEMVRLGDSSSRVRDQVERQLTHDALVQQWEADAGPVPDWFRLLRRR